MSINTHINNWISRAEFVDYYSLFISAWIPYNAWYMHNFYDENSNPKRETDAAIISHINSTSNTYRDKIISLLRGTDTAAVEFRKLVGNLHQAMENNPMPDFENRISFSTISLYKNNKKIDFQSKKQYTYFVEFKDQQPKGSKRWILEIQKKSNNQTLHFVQLSSWSMEELNNDPDFCAIPEQEKRNQLRNVFENINPKKPTEIIIPAKHVRNRPKQPNNSIIIDSANHLYFTNDFQLVSKVIVQLLYELRCKLFHGELNPTESNSGIYEFAYRIQKILIKELK